VNQNKNKTNKQKQKKPKQTNKQKTKQNKTKQITKKNLKISFITPILQENGAISNILQNERAQN
jgi:hypothetical protein